MNKKNNNILSKKNTKLLKNIIDAADSIIFVKDINEKYLLVNQYYASIFNLEVDEIIGKTDVDLELFLSKKNKKYHKSIFDLQSVGFTKNLNRDKYINLHCPVKIYNGNEKIFKVTRTRLFSKNKKFFATLFYANDITYIVRTEKELLNININLENIIAKRSKQLKLSEINFKNLFEKSNESIIIINYKGDIIDVNEKMCNMLSYSKKELMLMSINSLITQKFKKEYPFAINKIKTGGNHIFETEKESKLGTVIPFEFNSTLLNYLGEKAVLLSGRDITERKQIKKQVLRAILRTEENERKRFAKELHDGLGALLSGIKMYIDLIVEEQIEPEMIPDIMQKAKALIDEAADTAREVANNIKPHILTNFGLIKSIKLLTERFNNTKKIYIDYDASDYSLSMDSDFELTIYRIVNELINNTVKHANATDIKLNIRNNRNKLILLYSDNGDGFDVDKALSEETTGNGLKNILSRLETIDGTCEIMSDKNLGLYIRIKIDINELKNNTNKISNNFGMTT